MIFFLVFSRLSHTSSNTNWFKDWLKLVKTYFKKKFDENYFSSDLTPSYLIIEGV